jgi:serine-type D-Ala-D-Ala carboxypeptidase/endopeptidase (penicillin-binding protein 4)
MFLLLLSTLALAENVSQQIYQLIGNPRFSSTNISISVRRVDDGSSVFSYQGTKTLVPASTMKWLTAVTAVERLGFDHTLSTDLQIRGEIKKNKIHGDLIVYGRGAPDLSVTDLRNWANQLEREGIDAITGRVVVDNSFFESSGLSSGWAWDDLTFGYAAPFSAVNIEHNITKVTLKPPRSSSQKTRWDGGTLEECLNFEANRTQVDKIHLKRQLGQNTIVAHGGEIVGKPRTSATVSIPNPTQCVETIFVNQLSNSGISVKKQYNEARQVIRVAREDSLSLQEMLVVMLKKSHNLYAEIMTRLIDPAQNQKSLDGARKIFATLLEKAGVSRQEWRIEDGSGLSRYNLLSADALTKVSVYAYNQPYGKDLYQMLPIAGVDGTLANRMKTGLAKGNVHAKTGSMSTMRNISGYVTSQDRQLLAVSIFINGYVGSSSDMIRLQDQILEILASGNIEQEIQYQQKVTQKVKQRLAKRWFEHFFTSDIP